MFWKAWKPSQQAMPAAAIRPKTSSAREAMTSARQITTASSAISRPAPTRPSSSPATVKTKSVCCSGTKPDRVCEPSNEPLAEQPAVADRDPGLLGVVAGAARVEVGVGEGQEPVDLVVLRAAPAAHREHGGRDARRRRAAPASAAGRRRRPARRRRSRRAPAWCRGRAAAGSAPPGRPAISSISVTSTQSTVRRRRPSARSATTSAMPMTTASLANSAGWMDMPPSWIHERDPLMVDAVGQHQHQARRRTRGRPAAPGSGPSGGRSRAPSPSAPGRSRC